MTHVQNTKYITMEGEDRENMVDTDYYYYYHIHTQTQFSIRDKREAN